MHQSHLASRIALSIFFLLCLAITSHASAHGPYYSDYYGCNSCSHADSADSPPYFALHPPVYYSYPVYRTYGIYPFPYNPEPRQATTITVEPMLLINKFVEQKPESEARTANCQPLRIANPYVKQASDTNSLDKSSSDASNTVKPKVIFPIKDSVKNSSRFESLECSANREVIASHIQK